MGTLTSRLGMAVGTSHFAAMLFTIWTSLSLLQGCTSARTTPEFEAAHVVDRLGGMKEAPAWVHSTEVSSEDGRNLVITGSQTLPGNFRPEQCARGAAEAGREAIIRAIRDNLSSGGQVNETGSADGPAIEQLMSNLSQLAVSGIRVKDRYWERQDEPSTDGGRMLRLHCASRVMIPKDLFNRQLNEALGSVTGNLEVRERITAATKNFIDKVGGTSAEGSGAKKGVAANSTPSEPSEEQ